MRLLLVEDDETLRAQLVDRFQHNGYVVDHAANAREGLYYGLEYDAPIDVAIIDLGLPGLSGIELITKLRHSGKNYPILILTARSRWQEKVEGLEAGGDDYLTKPFHFQELQARVAALLRRAAGHSAPLLKHGPISVDTRSHDVLVQERRVVLTAFEYRLLYYLLLNRNRVVSKLELVEHLYADDADRDSNVIDVFIARLRRKLDPEQTLHPITTRRGQGYRLAPDKPTG